MFRWWVPTKFDPVKSPMLFLEKGKPILPLKTPEEGLDMVLKNMVCCFFHWALMKFMFEVLLKEFIFKDLALNRRENEGAYRNVISDQSYLICMEVATCLISGSSTFQENVESGFLFIQQISSLK